jgi:hypothetical protein
MKKIIVALLLVFAGRAHAQSYEVEHLILDIEKLSQLKSILTDLYTGYKILNTGYGTVKNISEGNFNLHEAFLDGLMLVSPAVKNYQRVADIFSTQTSIVSEYKTAYNNFKQDKHFNPDEITYLGNVYNNLIRASLSNLSNMVTILTANKLRMSDDERLHAIDEIYSDTHEKLFFLRQFNSGTQVLAMQRAMDANDVETIARLYRRN